MSSVILASSTRSPELVALENDIQTDALAVLADAKRYNQWIMDAITPYIGHSTLEIGCGSGTFSQLLLKKTERLTGADVVPAYVQLAKDNVDVPKGKQMNVICENFLTNPAAFGTYDSIVMLNVLEHIQADGQAAKSIKAMLNPGGRWIILVPALEFLYSDYDRSIHHHRRYTKKSINQLLTGAGFAIEHTQYFNMIGIAGWWLKFCILKKKRIDRLSVQSFEKLVPAARLLEENLPTIPFGLSLIAVARKI